jgi:hypothetical protein
MIGISFTNANGAPATVTVAWAVCVTFPWATQTDRVIVPAIGN